MKQKILLIILFIFIGGLVKSQSCNELPNKFSSYYEAINAIQNASFKYTDKLPQGKSSWIIGATYYSCDEVTGYLVYTTDRSYRYIHENVPIRVWIEFKNAISSGSYYNLRIKGRYKLIPE